MKPSHRLLTYAEEILSIHGSINCWKALNTENGEHQDECIIMEVILSFEEKG